MTSILGLNAYHGDVAAALVVDGELVAAAEEERFTRLKHAAGFPARAALWCLEEAGIAPGDLDHLAVSRDPHANVGPELLRTIRHGASARYLKERLENAARPRDVRAALAKAAGTEITATTHDIEHHLTHAASSFFVADTEEAALLSIDGFGDFASTLTGVGRGTECRVFDRVLFPHSLGMFYAALTQWLGFPHYGDEGKVMGLASYGDPSTHIRDMRDIVHTTDDLFALDLDYFTHEREGVDMIWDEGAPQIASIFSEKLIETLGPPRDPEDELTQHHRDVAAAVQRRLEEVCLHLVQRLHERTRLPDLCLSGGVALNAVANGRIALESDFERVHVPPSPGDSGTAIGAAYYVWHQVLGQPRGFVMRHAYTGPAYERSEGVRLEDDELCRTIAERIAAGDVVGWFQGRMEFGPRALGHRSILADPRNEAMREILNARIKHREPFRPFALSILAEETDAWLEQAAPSPFMGLVYRTRRDVRERIPAVGHVDHTARVQTVERDVEPLYYRLIEEFGRQTGVPLVLNTSFNENEPIVMTPDDALETFRNTHMDVLVLGNYIVTE